MASRAVVEQESLRQYQAEISAFSASTLTPYLRRLARRAKCVAKEINDPVWGTIHLAPAEVTVLDCPLLQRLRRIRQLGVVHLVYPGACHSRFEHSLGVLHQTSGLIEAIQLALAQARAGVELSDEEAQLLRLAALCHDIGHGVMSHVSENALAGEREVNLLERAFANEWRVEEPHISEIAAFYMIRSESFKELLGYAWAASGLGQPTNDPSEFLSNAIIGRPLSEDIPLLHEVITGPFDADKLDYLRRDAVYSGVPTIVDIGRIIRKVRVAVTNWRDLPMEIAENVPQRTRPYAITGIAQSGARTLDELALARALSHDKIYRHHKVRAAEAMVASVLTIVAGNMGELALLPLHFTDDQLLDQSTTTLLAALGGDFPESKVQVAADILDRLRCRELFVRSFAWERSPRPVGLAFERDQTIALDRLQRALQRRNDRGAVADLIAAASMEILQSLGQVALIEGLVTDRLKNYVWLDPPSTPKGRSLLSRALLITRDGTIRRFRDDFPDTEGWSDQYLVNRDVGYVFTPRELAGPAYLASEIVFRTKFGVRFDQRDHAVNEGVDLTIVQSLRQQLYEKGFYENHPTDLWPMPAELLSAATGQIIERFLIGATEYAAPQEDGIPAERLTAYATTDFVRQFRKRERFDSALAMLNRFRFFHRSDLVSALSQFLSSNPSFDSAFVCPLGSAKDSGAIIGYYANDLAQQHSIRVVLPHELPPNADKVIIVDDFIGSGRQAVDILEGWLGMERTEDLGEDRSFAELPVRAAEGLRNAQIAFSFCAGLSTGPDHLSAWLTSNNMSGSVLVANPESTLPSLPNLLEAGAVTEEFVEFCRSVGRELLLSNDYTDEQALARSIGYGNKGLLIGFPHNVPAHTVTALWEQGVALGTDWLPLLPRRRKR